MGRKMKRASSSALATKQSGSEVPQLDFERLVTLEDGAEGLPLQSVVKIFTTISEPSFTLPWQMTGQQSATGSGFVVPGHRIITNAHVVRDYTDVRIQKHGHSEKWEAEVLYIHDGRDLALITVKNPEFWKDLKALEVAIKLPELYSNVLVIGYPMGGETVSVTRGIVSRVTTLGYEESQVFGNAPELLAVQIDAAINPGNSGGPVLNETGDVVGVAFSGYTGSANNIGYIIPRPVIDCFFHEYEHGAPPVVCSLGISVMFCENEALRVKFKLSKPNTGVLITEVSPLSPAKDAGLMPLDILMAINDVKIDNDGTVPLRRDERVSFDYVLSSLKIGKEFSMSVLRDGAVVNLSTVARPILELVPHYLPHGVMPTYLCFGGVLFTPMTYGLLSEAAEAFGQEAILMGDKPKTSEDHEIVMIVSIFSHPVNHGYELDDFPVLVAINETKVLSVRQLKEELDKLSSGFVTLKLADGKLIVLDVAACIKADPDIRKTYAIPAVCSEDLTHPKPIPVTFVPLPHTPVVVTAASAADASAHKSPKSPHKGSKKPTPKAEFSP